MKKTKLLIFALFYLAYIVSSCSPNETLLEKESNIKTVGVNEAIAFMNANTVKKAGVQFKTQESSLDLNKITQEEIINSNQLLTVIPLLANDEKQKSRILLLKVNNEIQGVNFSMYPEGNSVTGSFTGKIMIYKLNGEFLNGFGLENGVAISRFFKKGSTSRTGKSNKNNTASRTTTVIINGEAFEEIENVAITFSSGHSSSISLGYVYSLYDQEITSYGSNGSQYGESWNFEFSGGGGEIPEEEPNVPYDKTNDLNKNPDFKLLKLILQSTTQNINHKESGFSQEHNGVFNTLKNGATGHELTYAPTSEDVGFMHSHLDSYEQELPDGEIEVVNPYGIFSPADVEDFLILLIKNQSAGNSLSNLYGSVVTSSGTYVLTYNGTASAYFNPFTSDPFNEDEYKRYISKYKNEEGFLRYLNEKIGIPGINLTKIENNTTQNLGLDPDNKLVRKPC